MEQLWGAGNGGGVTECVVGNSHVMMGAGGDPWDDDGGGGVWGSITNGYGGRTEEENEGWGGDSGGETGGRPGPALGGIHWAEEEAGGNEDDEEGDDGGGEIEEPVLLTCRGTTPGIKINSDKAAHWVYPSHVPHRDYQVSIVQSAILSNTLCCLPTGLGKTMIAAVVMYNYFRWFPEVRPRSRWRRGSKSETTERETARDLGIAEEEEIGNSKMFQTNRPWMSTRRVKHTEQIRRGVEGKQGKSPAIAEPLMMIDAASGEDRLCCADETPRGAANRGVQAENRPPRACHPGEPCCLPVASSSLPPPRPLSSVLPPCPPPYVPPRVSSVPLSTPAPPPLVPSNSSHPCPISPTLRRNFVLPLRHRRS